MIIPKKVLDMKKWEIYNIFNREKNLLAGSTTKNDKFDYNYSLAIHTGEKVEKIELNRKKFSEHFPKNFKFATFLQVHEDKIIDIDKLENFDGWLQSDIKADGMVTSKKNIALCILTADCMGLLAYDNKNKIIGAAHAGWRGTNKNIAKKMIDSMVLKGAKIENIKVALSPSIRGCCYEVGEDVANNFFKFKGALSPKSEYKWNLDISYVNKLQLLNLGIKEENIEVSNICTSCNSNDYFSYRKECGCSGRFINYIAMVDLGNN